MGLFFEVLSAINDPHQQGDVVQLEAIIDYVEQLTSRQGIIDWQIPLIWSVLGDQLSTILSQHRQAIAPNTLVALIREIAIAQDPLSLLENLIPPATQRQLSQIIAQNTGAPVATISTILPGLLLAVIQLLHMGTSTHEDQNALLDPFIETGYELAIVFTFADRFVNLL